MWSEETYKGERCIRWGDEVTATSPAKHGSNDWLFAIQGPVNFADYSIWPTNQAMLFGLGFMAKAQRDCFQDREFYDLWIGDWVDKAVNAQSTDDIRRVVENSHLAWERHRARQRTY